MKNHQFLIFLSVVLTIFSLTNLYIFLKGYNSITSTRENRLLYTIIFILLATTFIAGKVLEASHSSVFSDILNIIGGFWLGFMLYAFLLLLLSDITRSRNYYGPEHPDLQEMGIPGHSDYIGFSDNRRVHKCTASRRKRI
jgi:uncharacterized membrane protein